MKRSGSADLPLHYGHVPQWLAARMASMGLAITESILTEYGKDEMLRRLSDPFWFQSFGAVMGMDWHSSGITTSVLGALKRAVNPHSKTLGLYICGGKGKHSRQTPAELLRIAEATGLDGNRLVHSSKLSAKVDNNAVQDGFQLYTHNFILSDTGHWAVIQQGMDTTGKMARRYHWHSDHVKSFVEEPHTGICGVNQGQILNLTAAEASLTRSNMMQLTGEKPDEVIREFRHLVMSVHHDVREEDVNLKRLGAALWVARDNRPADFEGLVALEGVGPRTIQSLALVSEVIHGSPSRFNDPARFSFAHGGKDGHPFPVPLKVYDESISILQNAVSKARIGETDKAEAIRKLHGIAAAAEKDFIAQGRLQELIDQENRESWQYGGRTVFGDAKKPRSFQGLQLRLF